MPALIPAIGVDETATSPNLTNLQIFNETPEHLHYGNKNRSSVSGMVLDTTSYKNTTEQLRSEDRIETDRVFENLHNSGNLSDKSPSGREECAAAKTFVAVDMTHITAAKEIMTATTVPFKTVKEETDGTQVLLKPSSSTATYSTLSAPTIRKDTSLPPEKNVAVTPPLTTTPDNVTTYVPDATVIPMVIDLTITDPSATPLTFTQELPIPTFGSPVVTQISTKLSTSTCTADTLPPESKDTDIVSLEINMIAATNNSYYVPVGSLTETDSLTGAPSVTVPLESLSINSNPSLSVPLCDFMIPANAVNTTTTDVDAVDLKNAMYNASNPPDISLLLNSRLELNSPSGNALQLEESMYREASSENSDSHSATSTYDIVGAKCSPSASRNDIAVNGRPPVSANRQLPSVTRGSKPIQPNVCFPHRDRSSAPFEQSLSNRTVQQSEPHSYRSISSISNSLPPTEPCTTVNELEDYDANLNEIVNESSSVEDAVTGNSSRVSGKVVATASQSKTVNSTVSSMGEYGRSNIAAMSLQDQDAVAYVEVNSNAQFHSADMNKTPGNETNPKCISVGVGGLSPSDMNVYSCHQVGNETSCSIVIGRKPPSSKPSLTIFPAAAITIDESPSYDQRDPIASNILDVPGKDVRKISGEPLPPLLMRIDDGDRSEVREQEDESPENESPKDQVDYELMMPLLIVSELQTSPSSEKTSVQDQISSEEGEGQLQQLHLIFDTGESSFNGEPHGSVTANGQKRSNVHLNHYTVDSGVPFIDDGSDRKRKRKKQSSPSTSVLTNAEPQVSSISSAVVRKEDGVNGRYSASYYKGSKWRKIRIGHNGRISKLAADSSNSFDSDNSHPTKRARSLPDESVGRRVAVHRGSQSTVSEFDHDQVGDNISHSPGVYDDFEELELEQRGGAIMEPDERENFQSFEGRSNLNQSAMTELVPVYEDESSATEEFRGDGEPSKLKGGSGGDAADRKSGGRETATCPACGKCLQQRSLQRHRINSCPALRTPKKKQPRLDVSGKSSKLKGGSGGDAADRKSGGRETATCPACGKCLQQRSLQRHRINSCPALRTPKKKQARLDVSKVVCKYEDCAYIPSNNAEYREHLVVHPRDVGFACKHRDCGKVFMEQLNFEDHTKTHQINVPYDATEVSYKKSKRLQPVVRIQRLPYTYQKQTL
ncbi:unnamed protein product [Orchesella dallaii]